MPTFTHLFFASLLLLGGCATKYQGSDLSGTWVGETHVINSRGTSFVAKTLTLEVNQENLIRGTSDWKKILGNGGHRGLRPVTSASEDVIGVFDQQQGKFYLMEMEESGFRVGRFVSPTEIHVFGVQSGSNPVASFMELNKVLD